MKLFLTTTLVIVGLYSCKKAKIANTCENNSVKITPTDYNKDSAIIYMVTGFTPNGDGLNDMFRPFIWGIEGTSFEIRKGRMQVFSADNIKEGWDGTDEEGVACKDGVYSYTITGKNETDGMFEITGEVSLITEKKYQNCKCKYEDMLDPTSGFTSPSQEFCNEH